jgi:murein DD-endopeptidase MepM/ murein hydrolase activator NlpD
MMKPSPAIDKRKSHHPFQPVRVVGMLLVVTFLITACATASAQNPPTTRTGQTSQATASQDCAQASDESGACSIKPPTSTISPSQTPVLSDASNPSLQPTSGVSPTATLRPTAVVPKTPYQPDLCSYASPLFLRRPIDPPGNDLVDITYRFGSTQSGLRDPHHGVEFLNSLSTPVLAAGDGKVVVAGTDLDPISPHGAWPILFYGPYSNFYGNLVVIEHALPPALQADFPDLVGPIYTLYGHLSEIDVQVDQQVKAGQIIGKVGMAGIATGSHLHFEVRVGENSYKASHNPELWLAPHTGQNGQPNGVVAGRFVGTYNESLEMPSIVLQHLPDGPDGPVDFEVTVTTYEEKGLVGQPPFQESFGLGDLSPGLYRISFPMGGLRHELVTVYPGQLTVVTFRSQ